MTLRGMLYALARLLGDLNAISRGPGAMAKRTGRKVAWKSFGRLFR